MTDEIVINFVAVPKTLKFVTVVVVAAVNNRDRAFVASEKFKVLKVLEPVIDMAPVDPARV